MTETLELLLSAPFWVAVLRIATPLILGTLGVLLCERAGVLNLGIEGIMVAGAFAGWLAVYQGAGLWTGVAVAGLTAAGTALGTLWLWNRWVGHQGLPGRLGATFVPMALAAAGYFLAATSLGIREAADVLAVLRRRKRQSARETAAPQTSD